VEDMKRILLLLFVLFSLVGSYSIAQAWSQLFPTGTAPSARAFLPAVYDTTHNIMTIFGGNTAGGGVCINDVWVLSSANGLSGTPAWTQLSPTGTAPIARYSHTAVYDNTHNVMTIFGGTTAAQIYFNDVWVLSTANGLGTLCLDSAFANRKSSDSTIRSYCRL
jgi:hypothetical protein